MDGKAPTNGWSAKAKRIKAALAVANKKHKNAYITQIWWYAPPWPKIISIWALALAVNVPVSEGLSLQYFIMTDQPQSLKELFQAAKAQKQSIELSAEPNSDAYRQEVSETINKLQECQRLISQLSLFSSNEGLEDVPTSNLQ